MKNQFMVRSLSAVLLVTALSVHAEEKKDQPGKPSEKSRRIVIDKNRDGGQGEKIAVTFLGVETAPVGRTLAAQLGLSADLGLVVVRVMEGSPAASLLKEHDVLTKFDDQMLIDTRQLSVLVRARKEGEEVPLTLYRAGKELTFKAKLGQREMPKFAGPESMLPPGAEPGMPFFDEECFGPRSPGPASGFRPKRMNLRQMPGMGPEEVQNVLRMIGRERHSWFGAPPVQFFRHDEDKGSTMLNLAEGNFLFSDENGTVEVQASEGKRELTVKNPKGEITFQGPIKNDEDRKKLPPEVMDRLHKIENVDLNDEPGENFEHETTVEVPVKTNISQPLPAKKLRERVSPLPSF